MAVVIDASAVIRALTGGEVAAARLEDVAAGRTDAGAPDLLYAEIVNALHRYVTAGQLTPHEAQSLLQYVADLEVASTPCAELAADALELAISRELSGYDAMYLALAEATDSVLLTADRRLAAAAAQSELLD